ncbi:MAG: autotransporter outer membrane beta-barrel domain-containing protein [Pseudomonadota bacterium]
MRNFSLAIGLSFLLPDIVDAQQQVMCEGLGDDRVVICGFNGGTTSQIYSPGSVIILGPDRSAAPLSRVEDDDEFAELVTQQGGGGDTTQGSGLVAWFTDGTFIYEERETSDGRPGLEELRAQTAVGAAFPLGSGLGAFALYVGAANTDIAEFDYINRVNVALPVPSAEIDRREIGVAGIARLPFSPAMAGFVRGQAGRIALDTQREVFGLEAVDSLPIPGTDIINARISGSGETDGWSASVGAGLQNSRNVTGRISMTITASFDLWQETVAEYMESSGDGEPLFRFEEDVRQSAQSRLAISLARAPLPGAAPVTPSARLAWHHEFAADPRTINFRAFDPIADQEPADFSIETEEPDRDFFTLGLGLAIPLQSGALRADYETVLGHDLIEQHSLNLRFERVF